MIIHRTISQLPIRFLIDSKASQNFVSTKVAKKLKVQKAILGQLEDVILADGSEQPCNYFVEGASVQISLYKDKMNFFITKLKSFEAVLKKFQLEEYNSIIDWRRHIIRFEYKGRMIELSNEKKKGNYEKLKI